MSRVSTKQRHDVYIQLEKDIGTDAHFRSFLEGICYAEKIIASEKQDQPEPVAWIVDGHLKWECHCVDLDDCVPLYLHPAPQRSFVRLSEETVRWEYEKTKKNLRTVALTEYGWFDAGVRFAEKDYGIGGENE